MCLTFTFMSFTLGRMNTSIADRMVEKGYATDAALAEKVGCDRSMVTRIKHGKATPSLELAVKLSDALDLPASDFIQPDRRDAAA